MTGPSDPLAALRSAERARLDRFAAAFRRIDVSDYVTLADARDEHAMEGAQQAALELLASASRRAAVREAVRAFVDEATFAYSRRVPIVDALLAGQPVPDRAEDRVRFARGIERVVVALVLWDELDDADRAALVGPWATIVEGLV